MMHDAAVVQDSLTGLPLYRAFMEQFQKAVDAAAEGGRSVSMALVDLDRFAKLNEKYGRDVGDGVLTTLAGYLDQETGAKGASYRYGGDAFAVLLDGIEKEEAFLLVEELRKGFNGERTVPAARGAVTLPVSITAGVAAFPDDGAQATEITRKANEALYRAKVGGANKVCLAREEKMVTKTTHYTQGQLHGLSRLAKRQGVGEAELLREALDDLLRKHNA